MHSSINLVKDEMLNTITWSVEYKVHSNAALLVRKLICWHRRLHS